MPIKEVYPFCSDLEDINALADCGLGLSPVLTDTLVHSGRSA
jgi:hypothetical protein